MYRLAAIFASLGLLALWVGGNRLWPGGDPGGLRLSQAADDGGMTVERLGKVLVEEFGEDRVASNRPGAWVVTLGDGGAEGVGPRGDKSDEGGEQAAESDAEEQEPAVLLVMSDPAANRMRVMAPVLQVDLEDEDDLKLVLLAMHANYDRALDARYALHNGVLWSAFIHPLSSLTEADLKSGLSQVETLHRNTGTTFSSGGLLFAPGGGQEPEPNQEAESEPTV